MKTTARQPDHPELASDAPVFVRLSPSNVQELKAGASGFHTLTFRRGDRVRLNQVILQNLVVVQSGSFKIQNARGQTLQVLGPAELFACPPASRTDGEIPQARIMEAELKLQVLPWEQADIFLRHEPALLFHLFELMSARALHSQEVLHWTRLSVQQRAILLLNDLLDRYGIAFGRFEMINLPLTKIDMAHLTGTVQESIVRVISALRSEGLISSHGKRLIIHDPLRLREMKKHVVQASVEDSAS